MGTGRFERLERERKRPDAPAARPSVAVRFGGAPDQGETEAGPARSGAGSARFEVPESSEGIRVLDMDGGQSFVRCAACRADNFVNASRCATCAADLQTKGQRAFNEALWRTLCADKEDEQREVGALHERRAKAEREQAEAMRRRQQIELDLERRRERGLLLDEADDVSDPLRAAARGLGRYLGQTLVRLLPNRTGRIAACALALLATAALAVTFPRLAFIGLWVFFTLVGLADMVRRSRRL
jgi:hypothetical protein